ncbi:MAG: hypothetical protein HC859_13700 [Bacteroidia bacterium]|nr:hypothetical protein [Bacteroidia bacterium]
MKIKPILKYNLDLKIIVVALLYYFSARLGYFFAFDNTTALPAWPPSGIAFALLILMGRSSWPGITIGALVANVMAYWNSPGLPAQSIIAISSIISLGHTLEAVVGNSLVKRWIKDDFPFQSTKNAFRFLFVTLCMCLVGAALGTLSLYLNAVITSQEIIRNGFSWWVGNVVGILLFTPFILSVSRRITIRFSQEKAIEIGIFVLCSVGIYMLLRVDYLTHTMEHAVPFLILPFLLWLAFRFELIVAITGVLAASLTAIFLTVQQTGPFVLNEPYSSMLLLQIFLGVISISTIILSATVKERTSVQLKLQQFNENLEQMVQDRTRALNDEVQTRRKAEEKLKATNSELTKRNTELDNFVYSVSHDLRAPIASVLGLINLARKRQGGYHEGCVP